MSTDYFLDCKVCNEAVHITNNKSDPPIDKELVRMFLIYHGYGRQCQIILESEHTIEWKHIKKFKDFIVEFKAKMQHEGKLYGGIQCYKTG